MAAHRSPCKITLKKIGGLDVGGSIRDVFIGWGGGMFSLGGRRGIDWREKVTVQNCGRALVKPKNQPGWGCTGSLMAEMKCNLLCGLLKEAATLNIHVASPDSCKCLKPPFEPFTSL